MRKINVSNFVRNIYDFQLTHNKQHIGSCRLMINDHNATINHIEINDSHKRQGTWIMVAPRETEKILKKIIILKKLVC